MRRVRSFLSISDLNKDEILEIFEITRFLKRNRGKEPKILAGKNFALIFEKPSLRTRATFQLAVWELGGFPAYFTNLDIKLGVREAVKDVARNIERWFDGVIARVYDHNTLIEMKENSNIPIINALSDIEHPCQILADFFTIGEYTNWDYKISLAFIGDGANNISHSLILMSAIMDSEINIACPEGYEPKKEILDKAKEINPNLKLNIYREPEKAVRNVDFIYTDVWTSMGQEQEAEIRKKKFKNYQVNMDLLKKAGKEVKVMHCLPAHRGEEITDEVIDSEISIVFDQAENRLHTQKGLLYFLFRKL